MKKNIVFFIVLLVVTLVFISCESSSENQINDSDVVENEISQVNEVESDQVSEAEIPEVDDVVLEVGKKVPDFKMTDLDGEPVNISDYKGKIVMLNFWATWCQYCDLEMPDLDKVNKDDKVVVLAINVRENEKIVREYIDEGGYSMKVIMDEDGALAETFYVNSFPTTFFIDEEGILLGSVPGMMTMDQMLKILDDIKNEQVN